MASRSSSPVEDRCCLGNRVFQASHNRLRRSDRPHARRQRGRDLRGQPPQQPQRRRHPRVVGCAQARPRRREARNRDREADQFRGPRTSLRHLGDVLMGNRARWDTLPLLPGKVSVLIGNHDEPRKQKWLGRPPRSPRLATEGGPTPPDKSSVPTDDSFSRTISSGQALRLVRPRSAARDQSSALQTGFLYPTASGRQLGSRCWTVESAVGSHPHHSLLYGA